MLLSLRVHQGPGLFTQSFVYVFELMNFVRTTYNALKFPSSLAVAEVFPFDHVKSIDFNIEV